MSWFPWTTSTRGKGPAPSGYQTRAFRGMSGRESPVLVALFALRPGPPSSTHPPAPVLKATESRNSGRFLSVPLP